jgi:hypothetical protein
LAGLFVALGALILVGVIAIAQGERRRRRLADRVAKAWGASDANDFWMEERASEEWRETGSDGGEAASVDHRTWADLELDRVLAGIDRTWTGLGSQRLYARLRSGAAWADTPQLERLASQITHDTDFRIDLATQLAGSDRSLGQSIWLLSRSNAILVRWWYWIFPVLSLATLASLVAIVFDGRALVVVAVCVVLNMAVRMGTAWQVPGVLAPMRQLGRLLRTAERLRPVARDSYGDAGALENDLARLRPLGRIANWVSRDPLVSGELLAGAWEYLNILFILDANALLIGGRQLQAQADVVGRVARWVGDVDVAYAVASLRAEPRAWCIPSVGAADVTVVRGVWHPLIASPVCNDVDLVAGRGLVITGANMSGKSTYLRSMGIAAVLARAINTCPATSWEGRLFRVRSLMDRHDDLAAGKSYYQVEADGVVAMLSDATSNAPTLFLLDELLRGTNTVERLAAGEAVLRAFLHRPEGLAPHVVMVATHDGELVAMLGDSYAPFHFRETVTEDGLHFDYLRREGPASTRTAIALLEATGAPADVIAAARARADELDSHGGGT